MRIDSLRVRYLVFAAPLAMGCTLADAGGAPSPLPPSPVIRSVEFDFASHDRRAPGSDNWPLTWSDDDHQYAPWGDGGGFGGTNREGRVSLGVARIEGSHAGYQGFNRFGGLDPECESEIRGKAHGAPISLGGTLYMWITPGSSTAGYERFTLYRSEDKGCTWGRLEVEFTLSAHGIGWGGFVQFGRDNAGARDSYVYTLAVEIQSTDAFDIVQKPGEIVLLRVRDTDLEIPSGYEFFAGLDEDGQPAWSANASDRRPIFEDPAGTGNFPQVVWVAGLDRFVLTNQHGDGSGNRGSQSLLTMADAPELWGPWTIFYRDRFFRQNQQTVFQWNFAPKWFRNGGREFTLVFSGRGRNDSWNTVEGAFILHE